MLKNPKEGLLESEDIPHKELFKIADKYMGNIYCKML
jgi:homospermidine synthase